MNQLNLIIKNRNKVFYNGEALYVTSENDKGRFDILPKHANFISIVKDYIIYKKINGEEEKLDIKTGVLKNTSNSIIIYLETGRKQTAWDKENIPK